MLLLRFGADVKIVHFLGSMKPWHYTIDVDTGVVVPGSLRAHHELEHVQRWWDTFLAKVQPRMSSECSGICAHLASIRISSSGPDAAAGAGDAAGASGTGAVAGSELLDTSTKRRQWEAGQVDYLGQDSFESIQRKLDEKITGAGGSK